MNFLLSPQTTFSPPVPASLDDPPESPRESNFFRPQKEVPATPRGRGIQCPLKPNGPVDPGDFVPVERTTVQPSLAYVPKTPLSGKSRCPPILTPAGPTAQNRNPSGFSPPQCPTQTRQAEPKRPRIPTPTTVQCCRLDGPSRTNNPVPTQAARCAALTGMGSGETFENTARWRIGRRIQAGLGPVAAGLGGFFSLAARPQVLGRPAFRSRSNV